MLDRYSVIPNTLRASPVIFIAVPLIYGLLYMNLDAILLGISVLTFSKISDKIKNWFKDKYGNKEIPLFGRGQRPKRSNNCGAYIKPGNPIKGQSYGFPSGHMSIATFFAVVSGLHILNKSGSKSNLILIYQFILLLIVVISVGYSRVYIEKCHTKGQVMGGFINGLVFGIVYYCVYSNVKVKLI